MFRFQRQAHCYPYGEGGGFGGRGFHRGFGRPEGGRRRVFDQGDLRFVILKMIGEKPAHGYEIIKAIEDRLGGSYAPSPGVVYPTLTLLEELGYIAAEQADGPRKLFSITPEGRAALAQNAGTVDAIFRRMAEVNARFGGGPAPQIRRAYENLKTALKLRIGRDPLNPEQIAAITAILDDAAKAVEAA